MQSVATQPFLSPRDALFCALGIILGLSIYVFRQIRIAKRTDWTQDPDRIFARIKAVENILNIVVKTTLSPDKFIVLLFGPGVPRPTDATEAFHSRIWRIRAELRSRLESFSFIVAFGEDIPGAIENSPILCTMNIEATEKALAVGAGTIVLLASSVGSATELGIISQHDRLCAKTVIAIHRTQPGFFMLMGVAKAAQIRGACIIYYEDEHLTAGQLADTLFEQVLQKYQAVLAQSLLTSPGRIG